jgi:acetyl-CoA acetyltransferase
VVQKKTTKDLTNCTIRLNFEHQLTWATKMKNHNQTVGLTREQLDAYAAGNPAKALECAAARLTPERLDMCAAAQPWAALRYAAPLLTPERLDACAEAHPYFALDCAKHLLTPERLAWCEAQTN